MRRITPIPIAPSTPRRPADDTELRYWLENMVWHHRYEPEECAAALGLSVGEVAAAEKRLGVRPENRPPVPIGALRVMPYPGGRHPRIGFLDGAVDPQRETKFSVFSPWDRDSYVVCDFPEAVFTNLGLTYLAHTHVPTLWTQKGVALKPTEWERGGNGRLEMRRLLPNGIGFGTEVVAGADGVRCRFWVCNGTDAPLTGIRVQMCVMLAGAGEFSSQTDLNKLYRPPFAACRSRQVPGVPRRWVITAWQGCGRAWGNAPCPCLHSDPVLPPCEPGATTTAKGWVSFFEGEDVEPELERLARLGIPG